jgi:hypothetical protein
MFSFLYNDQGNELRRPVPVVYPKLEELPASSQGYSTNNKYPSFPPLMCDGRCVQASWQPEAELNNAILQRNNIKSNWEYRQYLTANAPEIMRQNFIESATDVGYYERTYRNAGGDAAPIRATSTSHPFLYASVLDAPAHLGNTETDLKVDYLTRELLAAKQFAPAVTQEELLRMRGRSGV